MAGIKVNVSVDDSIENVECYTVTIGERVVARNMTVGDANAAADAIGACIKTIETQHNKETTP